jgi:antitoxin component of RelBE/YafQ-DinJ toxin-antitoxin module
MNAASILIKTDPQVKKEAQETAKKMGLSLNAVVTGLLKEFTKRKTITFENKEELTPYAKEQLKKAREARKAGKASPIFDSADEMIAWLHKQGV